MARAEDPCGASNVGTARSQAWRRMERENEACGVSSSDKQVFLGGLLSCGLSSGMEEMMLSQLRDARPCYEVEATS